MDLWLRNAGRGLANAGKVTHNSLSAFGQNAGTALDSWGKEVGKNLDPNHPLHIAMTKTGETSFAVAKNSLRHLDKFGQHTEKSVAQAYGQLHKHVSKVDWQKLPSEAKVWAECTAKNLDIAVAKKAILSIKESELPGEIAQWIRDHPGQTAFIVVAGIVFFAPYLITVPVLASLGFTGSGVAAGSAAAAIHSMIGTVQAGSIFALLQSAGAGGAGLAVANGLVAVSAAGIAAGVATSGKQETKL